MYLIYTHTSKCTKGACVCIYIKKMRGKSSFHLRFPVSTYPHRQTILPVSCESSQGYFKHIHTHACVSRACYEYILCTLFFLIWLYMLENFPYQHIHLLYTFRGSIIFHCMGGTTLRLTSILLAGIWIVSSLLPLYTVLECIICTSLYTWAQIFGGIAKIIFDQCC